MAPASHRPAHHQGQPASDQEREDSVGPPALALAGPGRWGQEHAGGQAMHQHLPVAAPVLAAVGPPQLGADAAEIVVAALPLAEEGLQTPRRQGLLPVAQPQGQALAVSQVEGRQQVVGLIAAEQGIALLGRGAVAWRAYPSTAWVSRKAISAARAGVRITTHTPPAGWARGASPKARCSAPARSWPCTRRGRPGRAPIPPAMRRFPRRSWWWRHSPGRKGYPGYSSPAPAPGGRPRAPRTRR